MKKWKCPKELRPFLPIISHTTKSITKAMNGEGRSMFAAEAQMWLLETLMERGVLVDRKAQRLRKEAIVERLLSLTGCQTDEKSIRECTADPSWLLARARDCVPRHFKRGGQRFAALADMLETMP